MKDIRAGRDGRATIIRKSNSEEKDGSAGPRSSDQAIALMVKWAALATRVAQAGVSEHCIMAQTGQKSVMVARRYIWDGSLFRDNAAAQVCL